MLDRQPAGAPRRAAGRGALAADQHRTTLALITWGAGLCLVLLPWPSAPPSCAPGSYPGPDQQPHGRLRAAHAAAGRRLCRHRPWTRPTPGTRVQPGGGRRHPGCGGALPAGPRGIQELVDRRLNRRRYDTARIIATFSTRLRDQVDLTTLTGELLAVVNQTVQPTRTSLWLRPQGAAGATDGTAAHRFLSRR